MVYISAFNAEGFHHGVEVWSCLAAFVVLERKMSKSKSLVNPTRIESLAWTIPEPTGWTEVVFVRDLVQTSWR